MSSELNNNSESVLNSKELEDGPTIPEESMKVCFICREKEFPNSNCMVCHNLRAYHSKEKAASLCDTKSEHEDKNGDVTFPGPGIVKRNEMYGNYVVASRAIEAGELIITELPINIGPYAPAHTLPVCLTCCRDIGVSSTFKCSKCRWPICSRSCEKFYLHAENECELFVKAELKSKGEDVREYFSVETIRALLLRNRNVELWKRVLDCEPHIEGRQNDYRAKQVTDFIIHFIQVRCKLGEEFSAHEIDHVVGVLSVNSFWAFKELNRYASCLFDKITLFAHDCDPNTSRSLVFLECDKSDETQSDNQEMPSNIALQVSAARKIEAGEMITIRYIDINKPLLERRAELKDTFYFDCRCSRCIFEFSEYVKNVEKEIQTTDDLAVAIGTLKLAEVELD